MRTADLTGAALDWAVAKCEFEGCEGWDGTLSGVDAVSDMQGGTFKPSTDWAQGGAIIEYEGITVAPDDVAPWCAFIDRGTAGDVIYSGTTPLEAAMRCYVASKLGTEVEVPEELLSCAHD
jgi:hypothetical protein